MRRFRPGFVATFVLTLALAVGASTAAAQPQRKILRTENLVEHVRPFRDTIVHVAPEKARKLYDSGGVYTTKDGIQVHVIVSSAYTPNPTADQSIVDFLGDLLHSSELGELTVNIRTFAEMQAICGTSALACYDPNVKTMYMPGEDPAGVPLEQILAHEYGHHIAFLRSNPPWHAYVLGPKRWASYMNICARATAGTVFPGDEGANYRLNPGEGWAEAYRLTNARRIGTWTDIGWPIVDPLFMPDETAFGLVERDVLQPWTRPTVQRTIRGTLRRNQFRRWRVASALDGTALASVRAPKGARTAFFDASGRQVSNGARRSSFTICGQRSVFIAVQGTGKFTLTYALP